MKQVSPRLLVHYAKLRSVFSESLCIFALCLTWVIVQNIILHMIYIWRPFRMTFNKPSCRCCCPTVSVCVPTDRNFSVPQGIANCWNTAFVLYESHNKFCRQVTWSFVWLLTQFNNTHSVLEKPWADNRLQKCSAFTMSFSHFEVVLMYSRCLRSKNQTGSLVTQYVSIPIFIIEYFRMDYSNSVLRSSTSYYSASVFVIMWQHRPKWYEAIRNRKSPLVELRTNKGSLRQDRL